MGSDLLVEIGYLEPIYIRRSGDPRALAVGPSSYARSALYVPPSTILGTLATAMMDQGLLGDQKISGKEDLKAYDVLKRELGLRIAGPPYIWCKGSGDRDGGRDGKIYLFTAYGPLDILKLYEELVEKARRASDIEKGLAEAWRAFVDNVKKPGGELGWEKGLVRVSLEDPVKRAKEGYLFTRSFFAMGRLIEERSAGCYVYLPIQVSRESLRHFMNRRVPVKLGGSSRIASLRIFEKVDPLRIHIERLWRSGEEHAAFIAFLASPMPGLCNCYREDVAAVFREAVRKILERCRRSGECRVKGSFVHVDQQPEGWSLAAQRRRPYRAWVLPGSSLLITSCSIDYSKAEEILYAGGYASLVEEIAREAWEGIARKNSEKYDQNGQAVSRLRDLVEEGFGRFVLLPI